MFRKKTKIEKLNSIAENFHEQLDGLSMTDKASILCTLQRLVIVEAEKKKQDSENALKIIEG